jgi:spore coat polysaccharide biosynthesis predicted glycosyltransferase SpsG
MIKSLFFRADVSPEIGLGHVRRCAVLAQACRMLGAEAHLMVRSRNVSIDSIGDWGGARLHEMPWDLTPDEDAQWVLEACRELGLSKGVVDHYRLSEGYQERLIEAGLEWMQFGNIKHTHPLLGRWVHDASPGTETMAYSGRKIGTETEFLLGPGYALVSEGFRSVRALLPGPKEEAVESILITFGGGDDGGATMRVLGWLDRLGFEGRRLVLTGSANRSLGALRAAAEGSRSLEVQVGNWDPAEAMGRCQLAFCAGGTSLHELACLGLPVVTLTIADNQVAPAEAWQRAGLGKNLGAVTEVNDLAACEVIDSVLRRSEERLRMAEKAWGSQDGLGSQRVARRVLGLAGADAD